MSGQGPPPMSSALRALIDADSQRPGPSDGVRTGIYAALGVSLGVLPAGAIAAAQAAATTTGAAAQAAATTTGAAAAAAPTAGASAAATAFGAAKVAGPLALLAKAPIVAVGVGAVIGAALTAYVVSGPKVPLPSRQVTLPPAVTAPAAQKAPAESPPSIEPAAVEPARAPAPPRPGKSPSAAPARRAAAPAASASDQGRADQGVQNANEGAKGAGALAAEQSLLDPARAALAHGDGATALARLALHERRFPTGLLSQEREAMAVHALVLAGARGEAERRAATFRTRYPGSLLGPTIDATLRARP